MRRMILGLAVVLGLAAFGLAGCHGPTPGETDVLNAGAKLPAGLPVEALDWRAVTTSVDRAKGTTTLLTANDKAIPFTGVRTYPAGSELALVTWTQREDPHWFGARIPDGFVSLELVTVGAGADGKTAAVYRRFEGNPVHEVTGAADAETRKAAILGMRAAEMP